MANTTITGLTEAIEANNGDFFVIDTPDGTRKIQRNNAVPGRGSYALINSSGIDILNTRIFVLDPSDGRPREISHRDLVFGNFLNQKETQDFTLTPGIHNVRAVQVDEDGVNAVNTITLDGTVDGIAGCDFYLVNLRAAQISVVAQNILMNVDGVLADGVIRNYRAATITVNNEGTRAIFSGG